MYVAGYFLMAIANVLNFVLLAFMWIVIIRAILSWVNPDPYNPIVRFILYKIRTKLPINFGGIDLSPILVILAVYFLRDFVVKSLLRFSASLM